MVLLMMKEKLKLTGMSSKKARIAAKAQVSLALLTKVASSGDGATASWHRIVLRQGCMVRKLSVP